MSKDKKYNLKNATEIANYLIKDLKLLKISKLSFKRHSPRDEYNPTGFYAFTFFRFYKAKDEWSLEVDILGVNPKIRKEKAESLIDGYNDYYNYKDTIEIIRIEFN